jgi:hypothetical protein
MVAGGVAVGVARYAVAREGQIGTRVVVGAAS